MNASVTLSSKTARSYRRAFGVVLVAAVSLLNACEGGGGDWQQLFSWMKDDEPPPASIATVPPPPVVSTPASAIGPAPYRICRECPVQGDRVMPVSDRIVGLVERIDRSPEAIAFIGWAMDQDNPNAKLRLLVFAGGTSVAEGSTELLRLDVISHYRLSGEGRHGFHLSVPSALFRGENTQVNVFAVDHNGAMGPVRFSVSN